MEVMLIVGLFASSALSLNFIVNQKYKLAGSMNIINLCLVVATAYQFDQVKNIVWLFGIAAGVVLVYFVVRFLLKKKKKEKRELRREAPRLLLHKAFQIFYCNAFFFHQLCKFFNFLSLFFFGFFCLCKFKFFS